MHDEGFKKPAETWSYSKKLLICEKLLNNTRDVPGLQPQVQSSCSHSHPSTVQGVPAAEEKFFGAHFGRERWLSAQPPAWCWIPAQQQPLSTHSTTVRADLGVPQDWGAQNLRILGFFRDVLNFRVLGRFWGFDPQILGFWCSLLIMKKEYWQEMMSS